MVVGLAFGYWFRYLHALAQKNSLELELKEKLIETETRAGDIIERAETKAEQILQETKQESKDKESKLDQKENHLSKREEFLDERQIDLDSQKEALAIKITEIKNIKTRLDEAEAELEERRQTIANLTKEEAYEQIITSIEKERAEDLRGRIEKINRAGEEQYHQQASDLLLTALHRVGNTISPNLMTAHVELQSDEQKGKIIGREGRNVRAFERATGVDVLVDESPGYIVLSSFDPVRREIARVALELLIKDGRIQPTRIEEVVAEAQSNVAATIKQMGEKATYDANVPNLHPELVTILGRLHFRTSYGQNVLSHSVEMANIAGLLATEIGADIAVARAGALLHDIGKCVSHEVSGTHVEIGIRILEKYQVDQAVILAMRAHHEEYPYETPESILVQIADSVSGSRPGARRDMLENYIKRLSDIESIARELDGVERAFAIAAGREVRILVNPEQLSDYETNALAHTIAHDIESKLRYPGEIKVHVIRETRVVSYAR